MPTISLEDIKKVTTVTVEPHPSVPGRFVITPPLPVRCMGTFSSANPPAKIEKEEIVCADMLDTPRETPNSVHLVGKGNNWWAAEYFAIV